MGILSKDAYERKNEWAANKMAENAQNENLTQEQHDLLAELCRLRHEIHCNQEAQFNLEDSNCGLLDELVELEDRINESGLPEIKALTYREQIEMATSEDWYMIMDDSEKAEYNDDFSEWYEDALCKHYDFMNEINNRIENYLAGIDKTAGTSYCPSGSTRLY